jgi:branched-chain amino acid transport system permease protein
MSGGIVIQLGVDTVAAAALYALVALAVALAYSGSGILHLAIGQVGVAGGLAASAIVSAGYPVWLAVIAGLAIGAALSAGVERGLVAPTLGRPLLGAVLLLGAGVVLRELLQGVFPHSAYAFPSTAGTLIALGGIVHVADLVTIAAVALTAGLAVVTLRSTSVGAALRITAAAPDLAERLGVDTARVRMAAFAFGGGLATVAILLGVARFPLAAGGGVVLALRGIAAASAGRMRSPGLVVAAAVAIAAAQVVGGYFLGAGGEVLCDLTAVLLIVLGWRS